MEATRRTGVTDAAPICWCGEKNLQPYSPAYALCATCGTLVARLGLTADEVTVRDDEHAFYGREYWLSHQTQELGIPDIARRARVDLPERCMHWLQTLLRYKPPPARVLEVGCAHGGFVALLRWAGYDATGLELSPWVVEYARQTFGVPVLQGPIEEQSVPEGSLDAVILNDVVEHLPDPQGTLAACARLLKPDGVLVVQMPSFPEGQSYEELLARKSYFLNHMDGKAQREHLNLFSPRAARLLCDRLGFGHVDFVRAMFEVYDMYFVAGRQPLVRRDPEDLARGMTEPEHRIRQAWFDLLGRVATIEADRAARLNIIQRLDAECAARLAMIEQLNAALARSRAEAGRPLKWVARRLTRLSRRTLGLLWPRTQAAGARRQPRPGDGQ